MKNIIKFIPNSITITRIFMSFIFIYLISKQFMYRTGSFPILISFFLLICISDLIDGKIARKTSQTSTLGAKLDVFADLFYIIISYTTLIILNALPLWFLVFTLMKFSEFVITSNFIKRHNNSAKHSFVFDKIGRLVSASFFIIPGIICIYKCLLPYGTGTIISCLLYTILAAGLYSSYLRIKNCFMLVAINNSQGGYVNEEEIRTFNHSI